ncbi:MAG: PDZ domain-containing protein [Acidobacteria bacterium]|nr:PDZ domain-containing protein [Acidobacteriota bacterium]
MNRRGRLIVLALSIPIVVFAAVGGFMSRAMAAREESYQHLRIFEDVVTLIANNYVEDVDVDKVMHGAMHGLADGLDPDTAYLDATQVAAFQKGEGLVEGQTGLELTRQYYLRVIAARDGSPAARAGLQPGDYIRAIDGQSTRDTSVFEGMRLLGGKPGTSVRLTLLRGNAAEPHEIELTREALPALDVRGRIAAPGTGYLRVAEFGRATAAQIRTEAAALQKAGAARLVIDVRGNAFGDIETGLAAARLFVPSGTLAFRQDRGKDKEPIAAASGDGTLTLPVVVLTDNGTAGAAELFAGALQGNRRAQVVGERTRGRAGRQKLVKLPDGSGLLLTHLYYLLPGGGAINEKGLVPDIAVEQPAIEFGQAPPAGDPLLEKAIESLTEKKAA